MKFISLALVGCILFSCSSKTTSIKTAVQAKLKARFEVHALCSNYTFSLIGGQLDSSLIESSWTNPQTEKTYQNAFAISNPCDLPKDLKAGDEFYFEINKTPSTECAVCMAYYPTPSKKLSIKVLEVIKK